MVKSVINERDAETEAKTRRKNDLSIINFPEPTKQREKKEKKINFKKMFEDSMGIKKVEVKSVTRLAKANNQKAETLEYKPRILNSNERRGEEMVYN